MPSDLQVEFTQFWIKSSAQRYLISLPEVAAILFGFLLQVSLYAFRQRKPL
jgi:hypothetical protein